MRLDMFMTGNELLNFIPLEKSMYSLQEGNMNWIFNISYITILQRLLVM